MTSINPLTREQKLLAEIVVQLGNITEAIQAASAGEDSSELRTQIEQLQAQLAEASVARAALTQQIATSETTIAELQTRLAAVHSGDITPDNINQVMSTLGIDYDS